MKLSPTSALLTDAVLVMEKSLSGAMPVMMVGGDGNEVLLSANGPLIMLTDDTSGFVGPSMVRVTGGVVAPGARSSW